MILDDEPPTGPTRIELPSGPILIDVRGEGLPVVLLHGVPGSHRDFRRLVDALEGALRVVRLDLPGYGESPVADGEGVDRMARAVVEVIEHLHLPPAVLVGHSFGGIIATRVATTRPDLVAGIGLIATPGLRPHDAVRVLIRVRPVLAAALATPLLRRAMVPMLRPVFRAVGIPVPSRDDVLVRSALATSHAVLDGHASRLRRVRVPTLVAWAEDDRLIEPAIGDGLAATLPAGPRLRFTQGGHGLQHTRAEEIGAALVAWVPGLGAARLR